MPSKAEARALRLMRKLHAITGGNPKHWATLDYLGAVQADAAAIVYAVEMRWILAAPKHDLYSVSLTEWDDSYSKSRPSTAARATARDGRSA
jgi:hypothetical protein